MYKHLKTARIGGETSTGPKTKLNSADWSNFTTAVVSHHFIFPSPHFFPLIQPNADTAL